MSPIIENLSEQLASQSFFDWGATIGAIIYLYLISRENPWGWFWGIVGCGFWAYAAWFQYQLYIDSLLQIFYIVISFWGIWLWLHGGDEKRKLPITRLSPNEHLLVIVGGTLGSLVTGWLFDRYTGAAAPYWDAFTTVFSIITTFMVMYKKLDNWIYWLIIDAIYVGLYWSRGGYLFALLFLIYLIIVVQGYFNWRKLYAKS
ncbi:MAG: nicotinamide mononucleotide transporter [Bacteroidetes bacterium]|nr:nicotinamide mononucleotide transporter [Bacteroidota bacterium]